MSVEMEFDEVKAETDGEMLARLGMDGAKWAKEFISHYSNMTEVGEELDESTMIDWFANSIMAGFDRGVKLTLANQEGEFHEDAMRTAAGPSVFYPNDLLVKHFLNDVLDTIAATRKLDRWKSILFYGKDKAKSNADLEEFRARWTGADFNHVANPQLIHAILGIMSEGGEMGEHLVEAMFGELKNGDALALESGDVDWFQELLATAIGVPVNEGRDRVISKLRLRFPEKFNEAAALSRADEPRGVIPASDGDDGA